MDDESTVHTKKECHDVGKGDEGSKHMNGWLVLATCDMAMTAESASNAKAHDVTTILESSSWTCEYADDLYEDDLSKLGEVGIGKPDWWVVVVLIVRNDASPARLQTIHKAEKTSASIILNASTHHQIPTSTKMVINSTQLSAALTASGLPAPSPHFLTTILSSQRMQPPLPALVATAKHRLLSSDITVSPCALAANTASFPADVASPQDRERKLMGGAVVVQVVGVEDLSKSRWEQLEAIEAQERGEMTKGREIIRVVETEEGADGGGVARASVGIRGSRGPHRLVLQDVKGQTVHGLELKPVKGVGMGMTIGTKIALNDATVARGVVLLEPETVVVLGGKIDVLHKAWVENRKRDLLAAV